MRMGNRGGSARKQGIKEARKKDSKEEIYEGRKEARQQRFKVAR
jgi:hypothetical protein